MHRSGFVLATIAGAIVVSSAWGQMTARSATTQPATTQPAAAKDLPLLTGPVQAVETSGEATDGKGFSGKNMRSSPLDKLDAMLQPLGLSDRQHDAVQQVVASHTGRMQAFNRKTAGPINQLKQQIAEAEEVGDTAKVKRLRQKITDIQKDRPSRTEILVGIRKVLTTPQYRELIANARYANHVPDPADEVGQIVARLDTDQPTRTAIAARLRAYQDAERRFLEKHADELHEMREKIVEKELGYDWRGRRRAREQMRKYYQKHGPDPRELVREVSALLPVDQRLPFAKAVRERVAQLAAGLEGQPDNTKANAKQLDL